MPQKRAVPQVLVAYPGVGTFALVKPVCQGTFMVQAPPAVGCQQPATLAVTGTRLGKSKQCTAAEAQVHARGLRPWEWSGCVDARLGAEIGGHAVKTVGAA